jgi:rhamnulose-1-phosphate aldolase
MNSTSFELNQLLAQMGQAGKHLFDIHAAEAAAGNLSVCVREELDISSVFPVEQPIDLPVPAPDLAGATLIVSGSGRRLREIVDAPAANLACIVVEPGGVTGRMFTSPDCPFQRVTSEFSSHLAVHHDRMRSRDLGLHAIIHAQPLHLTYLSHLAAYQDESYLNRHLLRWQPETIFHFSEGIAVLPFLLPGSPQLTDESVLALREHAMVIWSQHGVMVRADKDIFHALDLIEYAETAARYEFLNLSAGGLSRGLSPRQLRRIVEWWKLSQKIF